MRIQLRILALYTAVLCAVSSAVADNIRLYGRIVDDDSNAVPFASVGVAGVNIGTCADAEGNFELRLKSGEYTFMVSAVGYEPYENRITLSPGVPHKHDVRMRTSSTMLDDVVVSASLSGVSRLKRSAFNVVAVDTKEYLNSTKNLSDILAKMPGLKLREAGGVGSDIQISMDGFSGKHVKVFIDGVPQEGVGSSFGLNNIPVNYAERIEVYRGVVPVGFGTDAMGGIINIVTRKAREGWNAEASYSYGSFNTHKSYVNFAHVLDNGFTYEINAFQNYSDNNYEIYAPVEDFETGRIEKKKLHRVERFNDTYHNEALSAKVGVVDRRWADRMMLGVTYSQMYKDIQTGVRQEIVYGKKHRHGYSLMPSFEYRKRNLFAHGLDVSVTANYNRNSTTNVDTASHKYNWYGEKKLLNTPGEQSNQRMRADNDNYNATFTADYRLGSSHAHLFTLHHVFNAFRRSNTSLLSPREAEDPIAKRTHKNITGLSYRFMPGEKWNVTAFGKYYSLYVGGPVATTGNQDDYVEDTRTLDAYGYGVAGTFFFLQGLQAKFSYEKAYRLPTIEEMFGDEDLEMGDIGIDPESSHNINLNLSYNNTFAKRHTLYAECGVVYRDTRDYIQRNIIDISGGKAAATYINYGKVLTKGYNVSLRYSFDKWLSIGGNITRMEVLDNMKTAAGSTMPNIGYKECMPNLPALFADFDASFYWHNLFGKDNTLTLTYENRYVEEFSYYSSKLGANKNDYMVPDQFSHNISLAYSVKGGRYNFAFECVNLTDERLYDNFSLQKAGRAFYGKIRVCFGNR